MKTVGIIAEYNPFHKGHAYQLQKAKELSGADYAVIVMSGDFVQRGYPAIVDKYVRAEMALRAGADLVIELPVSYAVGSAEAFAQGAVSVLEALGCVDFLCFGSESGDLDTLLSYARLFEEEPPAYRAFLQDFLRQGFSFPAARSQAAEEYRNLTERILPCCSDDADFRRAPSLLDEPNNILGIEYCRALLGRNSSIRPLTLRRRSAGYHDLSLDAEMASASAIRHAVYRGSKQARHPGQSISGQSASEQFSSGRSASEQLSEQPSSGLSSPVLAQLPPFSEKLLRTALAASGPVRLNDFSSVLSYLLLSLPREALAAFQDVGEDLAARMGNCRFQFTSAEEFADLLKTRQLTHTRVTRALCHILLNLKQTELDARKAAGWPVYLRVLGFRETARPLLGEIKKRGSSPLLVKAADASHILTSEQLRLFEEDIFAAHVYEAVKANRNGAPLIHEFTRSPILAP